MGAKMSKIKLLAPEGLTSVSFEGREYPVAADRSVEVPAQAALSLYGFGFGNLASVEDNPAGTGEHAPQGV